MPTREMVTKQLQAPASKDRGNSPRRTHGLGTVYRRGGTWWIKYYHRGRARYESSRSASHADAIKLLRKRIGELGRGVPEGARGERLTLDDIATILFDDYAANERKTGRDARRCMKRVQEFFGKDARAVDISADRLNAFVKSRRSEGAAASTIRNELNALKRGLNLAVRAGLMAQRPIFPTIELRNTRTGFFEQHEFDAVCEGLPPEMRAAVKFLYLTGWRVGEVLPLRWDQVSFPAGVVRLPPGTTKNDEGRAFPFSALPELREVLREQRDRTDAVESATGQIVPWVFHHQGRRLYSERNIAVRFRTAWARSCAAAGLQGRILHDFRRTAVRNLERAGVPRSVAMKLTGHKTESVYRRYAIVSEADLAEGVAKLSRLHEALASPPGQGANVNGVARSAAPVRSASHPARELRGRRKRQG